ncbi:nucleoside triphosphate pyrophosphohydrolase [Lactobacillus xylocopicola]|uniref:Phosphoribosyl-ATP pyrophosphohydrolase n=1 Tax=Lactobacillus xylocopicola TaxID=2976676 RepID=A0ABN6SNL9_9LACO|nr:nucleoside triphosphate pyrophosphohydrolase [Lactobacillus xylocopicola]BDR60846.1 phosphoribosyl-ATP pyrophosphohydrolase [Lactobacillus xylocopicola]
MEKLVRDKIPELAKAASFRQLSEEEIEPALKKKLLEETNEVLEAQTEDNLLEELGDVYEVLVAYLNFKGISRADFLKLVEKKRSSNGGFTEFWSMKQ